MFYEDLLSRFVKMSREIFGSNLVGIYLHGSLAMGCFNPQKSDIDLLLVVEEAIPQKEKREFMDHVVKMNEEAPEKGIELSVVRREFCNPFVYPTPFELHFSVTHLQWYKENPQEYVEKMNGTDKDLAAHFVITRNYGKVLYGEEIRDIFGEIGKSDYIDSIWFDIQDAEEDILSSPMYIILNLCRALAYLRKDLILSKKAGGEWGLEALPEEYQSLIRDALQSYETGAGMAPEPQTAESFAKYMLAEIENYKNSMILC